MNFHRAPLFRTTTCGPSSTTLTPIDGSDEYEFVSKPSEAEPLTCQTYHELIALIYDSIEVVN